MGRESAFGHPAAQSRAAHDGGHESHVVTEQALAKVKSRLGCAEFPRLGVRT